MGAGSRGAGHGEVRLTVRAPRVGSGTLSPVLDASKAAPSPAQPPAPEDTANVRPEETLARVERLTGVDSRDRTARRRVLRRWRVGGIVGLACLVVAGMPVRRPYASTVAEQRARLPPPAACKDPVAGIWQSQDYDTFWGEWTVFTLEVHRVKDSENDLEGKIFNHSWFGPEAETEPGPCAGQLRFKVSMDAKGTAKDGQIDFWGIGEWRLDEVLCGYWNLGYNLDHFTGKIDPDLQEFQSVNNDGGRAVNDPTVFRRIKCWDEQGEDVGPRVAVEPPPFYPPVEEVAAGCGCVGAP
jgi:hypothetical protein